VPLPFGDTFLVALRNPGSNAIFRAGCEDSDMDLLIHGQDREQNFVKFFVKLCAAGTPNTPVRSSLLH
jgi:RNase P/RNase MRP subunit p30